MRLSERFFRIAALVAFGASLAAAQSSVDVMVGFGEAFDKANGTGIDNANSPTNAFGSCVPNSGDTYCQATSSLNAFFLTIKGDIMLYKHFGVDAEGSFQPSHKTYGPLLARETFYDFNGVYQPWSSKRAAFRIEGGIGGARTSLSFNEGACVGNITCTNSVEPVGSANHFAIHVGAGVQFFVTQHIFIQPQFDYRYVPGLTDEFNSNSVPSAMVAVGFAGGDR